MSVAGNAASFGGPRARVRGRIGFTLPEMLIAMTVTLLLMAALGKSFGLIGESIRDGRSKVDLTSRLRDVNLRINRDLKQCTVATLPQGAAERGNGYFVYYEGPMTNVSGQLMGRSASAENENTLQDAKFGDLDDYLAFTAVAEDGNWFKGKVPRFVLDQKTAQLNGDSYDPADFPGSPLDAVMISSKYAEIVYFASPEYETSVDADDPAQEIFSYNPDTSDTIGNPVFTDIDSNGIPDRIRLHRRVLLIRPDLNLANGAIASYSDSSTGVEYLTADAWPGDTSGGVPSIKTPGNNGINRAQTANAWLIGMAPVHQQCDLSLRRVLNAAGEPTATVAANSLADLTSPENRFAHVRMPGTLLASGHAGSRPFTTMPVLALGGRMPLLNPGTNAAVPSSSGAPVITPQLMNGFLRPEFVLGEDLTHTDYLGDGWGVERKGEDVLTTDVLGFDLKGFDPAAPSFVTVGADGAWGAAMFDDDNNGTDDDASEAGMTGTDDTVVGPNDAAMRETLISGSGIAARSGDFVDLFYPYLAGGAVRGPGSVAYDNHGGDTASMSMAFAGSFRSYLETSLSGLSNHYLLPGTTTHSYYTKTLYKSGRMITETNGNVVFMQPAYDTFTNRYERDGFLQAYMSENGGSGYGTVWYSNDASGNVPGGYKTPDMGTNGIDDGGLAGADDASERESSPPFPEPLPALKVSVRIENSETRQIEQMSTVTEMLAK